MAVRFYHHIIFHAMFLAIITQITPYFNEKGLWNSIALFAFIDTAGSVSLIPV